MDLRHNPLVQKAYANPRLKQNIANSGTMFLYCDYAGFASQNVHGIACCTVFNHSVGLYAKRLPLISDHGSVYGELMAVLFSLETLAASAAAGECEHLPKIAVIYSDCSRISHLLAQEQITHAEVARGREELLAALTRINDSFPRLRVQIKYISRHKQNNYLHRLAHNAAREAALAGEAQQDPPIL
ncbi:hypothetical protein [Paenibacillus glycanilyticus]|uniref:RNase H type-1 domain-containing protein n=1 Tax=Paenibacillus glycanilyticus TaxID=126569 RepID=A0ABQ6GAT2_9BACL|nr:hypothetical protein [Paenibacillus glycanilyticus]GLX66696.1 hypothetical protein MU1_10400 [Paenibacillus glycanilyticus]